jgi:hypothetical protein
MTSPARPSLEAVQSHIDAWGVLATTEDRLDKRLASTYEQLQAFHDAMVPHLQPIIEYLNQFPLAQLAGEDLKLARATLALCEVDNAVNKWREPVLDTGIDVRRMIKKTSFSDRGSV